MNQLSMIRNIIDVNHVSTETFYFFSNTYVSILGLMVTEMVSPLSKLYFITKIFIFYFLFNESARPRSSSKACIVSASNPPANCNNGDKN